MWQAPVAYRALANLQAGDNLAHLQDDLSQDEEPSNFQVSSSSYSSGNGQCCGSGMIFFGSGSDFLGNFGSVSDQISH